VGPLVDAFRVRGVLRRLDGASKKIRVLGPVELAPYVRRLTPFSPAGAMPAELDFDWIVVRQEWIPSLDARLARCLDDACRCVYANDRYALFAPGDRSAPGSSSARATVERLRAVSGRSSAPATARSPRRGDRAALMTTFNRPGALRRSLPQIAALGMPMLVVDDGSDGRLADENRSICAAYDAAYLPAPGNRGISTALNIGLSYLLADCGVDWISYLQDDVDVDPQLLTRLREVEDRHERPLITGYDAPEHATLREARVGGVDVKLKATTAGIHLHAHRDYWTGVLPIPTAYLGAPRPRWGPPIEDAWIVHESPKSAGARGLLVPCLPGLVTTFLWHPADSTWANAGAGRGPVVP